MSGVGEPQRTDPFARLAMLGDTVSSRFRRVATAYLVAESSWRLAKSMRDRVRNQLTYQVTVDSDDDIYADVHRWLLEQIPPGRLKALHATMDRDEDNQVPANGAPAHRSSSLRLAYEGGAELVVRIGGHRVVVAVVSTVTGQRTGRRADTFVRSSDDLLKMLLASASSERITFSTYGAEGRDAVVAFLRELVVERDKHRSQPAFFLADRWGNWERRDDLPRRELASIVLRAGQKERLVEDLTGFLAGERDYARLGVPWHRGYLLHGPAGTGKTSVAQALATHFDLDLYYLPLSDLPADASLLRLVGAVRARSLLLLEDIDVVRAARERNDDDEGATLSGLLNALDGVATPHGLITVMTTNNIGVLDDALIRAGRIDRIEEIDYLDDDQLARLTRVFLPGVRRPLPRVEDRQVPPAAVIEIVKRHVGGDPTCALDEIAATLQEAASA